MGWALMEKLTPDPVSGRYIDPALTNHHIPANADVPDIEVLFIDEPDTIAHPLGSKGMGEVVSVGMTPYSPPPLDRSLLCAVTV